MIIISILLIDTVIGNILILLYVSQVLNERVKELTKYRKLRHLSQGILKNSNPPTLIALPGTFRESFYSVAPIALKGHKMKICFNKLKLFCLEY
jgi:hypothetical protein